MKRSLAIAFALVLAVMALGAQSADSISKASTTNYYKQTSLSGEDLWKAVESYACSVSVATVNADGTPNVAVVIPGVTKDRQYLYFGLAPNQTGINFKERKFAIVTFIDYKAPTATAKMFTSGARVVVEYVSDPAVQARLVEENKDKKATPSTIFMKILQVLPIG
ncbi:MAG TPA: pyridoxamine 5'-phosphate oxidase family protein [Rectinemataceae bacterium]